MLVLVQANILTVGLDEKSKALQELPIRIVNMKGGKEAARSLKNEKFDSVISSWDITDMKNGRFIKKLKSVKPEIPTIVFVEPGNKQQEITARSFGANAVLPENINDESFRDAVINLLGLEGKVDIKSISPLKQKPDNYEKVIRQQDRPEAL
jgi:DNA-binding NarL/FixJ family response regulator